MRIRDQGWKKSGSEIGDVKNSDPDPQHSKNKLNVSWKIYENGWAKTGLNIRPWPTEQFVKNKNNIYWRITARQKECYRQRILTKFNYIFVWTWKKPLTRCPLCRRRKWCRSRWRELRRRRYGTRRPAPCNSKITNSVSRDQKFRKKYGKWPCGADLDKHSKKGSDKKYEN